MMSTKLYPRQKTLKYWRKHMLHQFFSRTPLIYWIKIVHHHPHENQARIVGLPSNAVHRAIVGILWAGSTTETLGFA